MFLLQIVQVVPDSADNAVKVSHLYQGLEQDASSADCADSADSADNAVKVSHLYQGLELDVPQDCADSPDSADNAVKGSEAKNFFKKIGAPFFNAVSADSAVKGSDPGQGLSLIHISEPTRPY